MSDEIILICPFPDCEDRDKSHHHLSVNVEKGKYYCFLCGRGGNIGYLLKRFPELSARIGFVSALQYNTFRKMKDPGRMFFSLLKSKSKVAEKCLTYLLKRGMTMEEIKAAKVLMTPDLHHRVVFPHLIGGPKRFWTARAVLRVRPTWRNPKKGETALTKSQVVWGLEAVEQSLEDVIWISEGIFDAIAVKGVCVYGKKPSAFQLRMVMSLKPHLVVIGFDRDARKEAEDVQRRLRPFVQTKVWLPQEKDYGMYLKLGERRRLHEQVFG